MALPRLALTVLTFLLLMSGCAGLAQRDLVRALAQAGCSGTPAVEYQQLPSSVVLSVSVQQCVVAHPGSTGELVGRAEAAEAMGRAIWSSATYRFDSVMLTVYRTADEPRRTRPQSVMVARDQLAADFGPRTPALDSPRLFDDGGGGAWRYLPLLAVVIGILLLAGVARAVRTGGVLPVLLIRR